LTVMGALRTAVQEVVWRKVGAANGNSPVHWRLLRLREEERGDRSYLRRPIGLL
jgi:hypothetical protein